MALANVPETTVTLEAAAPPNRTVAPLWKPVPASVTSVSPASDPRSGVMDVNIGGATNVNALERVADRPPGSVTLVLER